MQSRIANHLMKLKRLDVSGKAMPKRMSTTKQDSVKPVQESIYISPTRASLGDVHKVDKLERYFLVWTKKFKHVNDVPAYVSRDTMEKSRNIMRIRINLSLIVITLIGAFCAAQLGRKAAEEGHSVTKMNIDWHNQYNKSKEVEETPPKK